MPDLERGRQKCRVHIRWMIRRDLPEVLENERSGLGWTEDDFCKTLGHRNCIGLAAECSQHVVGHVVYRLRKHRFEILNLCVAQNWRRLGIGGQIIDKMIGKLSQCRRGEILIDVPERLLLTQLFLRSKDFKAIEVVEDAYRMAYFLEGFTPVDYECDEAFL